MRDVPRRALAAATRAAWPKVVASLPGGAYLVGGTALAVRFAHRVSRDLDVLVPVAFDVERLRRNLVDSGDLVITSADENTTLNGVLDGVRVQFLCCEGQELLDPPDSFEGMPVAGVRDLLATKVKVLGDRGELRDYFDIMTVEQRTPHRMEHGLGYYQIRYRVGPHHASIAHIVRAVGSLDDVEDDPGLPVGRADIERFFSQRHAELVRSLRGYDLTHGQPPSPPRTP